MLAVTSEIFKSTIYINKTGFGRLCGGWGGRPILHAYREHIIKSTCDENVNQLTLGGGGLRPCNITIAQNQPLDVFTFFTEF